MTSPTLKSLLAATLLVFISAAGQAVAGTNWVKAESEHFVVYSNASAKLASTYAVRLEQYRYILSGFYGLTPATETPAPKLSVYFVESLRDLKQTLPAALPGVLGYYKDCAQGAGALGINEDDAVRTTKDAQSQDENTSQTILFHEYAHTFMLQNSEQRFPPWFVEGFAEYYSTTKIQGDQAVVGMAFSIRVLTLMSPQSPVTYEDILRDTWRPKKKAALDDHIDTFYAQSWLLTHYILSDPKHHEQFDAFVTAYRKGEDPVAAFETAFGIKVKGLDKILDTYLNKNIKATLYRINAMPQPNIAVTPMPASADKLLLWDFASRTCASTKTYPDLLPKIRTEAQKYPGDDYAASVLARAEIIIGDEWKALDFLTPYLKAHPDDAEAQSMVGQAWYLMTVHKHILDGETADSQMKTARKALGTAYGLDPLDAPNLYYFALAQDFEKSEPSDNAINAAMEAHFLIPSVEDYSLTAADMLIRKGRMNDAKDMLVPLSSDPHNPRRVAWINHVVARIDEGASKADVLRALHGQDMPQDDDASGKDGNKPAAK